MDRFKLHSSFKPTGDQPQAIKELVQGLKNGLRYQTLLGVTGSGKTFTMANVINQIQKPTLVISHNKTLAAQLYSEFLNFFPHNAVCYFVSYYDYYQPEAYVPQTDTYIAKETDINEEIDRLRQVATSSLLSRRDVLIVASVSCIYGLGDPQDYKTIACYLNQGEEKNRRNILAELIDIQYERNDYDFGRGKIRVRGDTLDIFPSYADNPYRIEFAEDKIKKIYQFDFLTGNQITNQEKLVIYPAKHFVTPHEKLSLAIKNIRRELEERVKFFKKRGQDLEAQRIKQRTEFDLEMLEETGYCQGIENYSRHLSFRKPGEPPQTLIDYFPSDYLLIIDESHMTIPQIGGMYNGDRSRKKTLVDYGFRLPSALDNRPLKFTEFENKVNQVIYTSATPGPYELKKSQKIVEQIIRPTGLLDPEIEVRPTQNQIEDLIQEIKERKKKKQRVLITTLSKKLAEDLSDYLNDIGIKAQYLHYEIDTLERVKTLNRLRMGKYDVVVGINLLREGLDLPEVSLVIILDADKEGFLRSDWSLIQVMGRAARHVEGKVIMYADKITKSMKKAIQETERRRRIQKEYNLKNKIKPQSIVKKINQEETLTSEDKFKKELDLTKIDKQEIKYLIKNLEDQMNLAAQNLEFEKAAFFRDEIKKIKNILKRKKIRDKLKFIKL